MVDTYQTRLGLEDLTSSSDSLCNNITIEDERIIPGLLRQALRDM